MFCAIPVGEPTREEYLAAGRPATVARPEVEGGPPHFAQGMSGEFTVE